MALADLNAIERRVALPPGEDRSPRRRSRGGNTKISSPPGVGQVLIVDDEALVALTLEAMVQDAGHVVVGIATNATTAFALAIRETPNIVLMDVRLGPVGNEGIDAAVAIVARTGARIIFVTAYTDPAKMAQLNAAVPGVRVLAKPISARELAEAIGEALRGP